MALNEKTNWEPGALVQIRRDVQGAGDIGVVIGPTDGLLWRSSQCLDVLFGEGMRQVHPSNLQVPRARRPLPSPGVSVQPLAYNGIVHSQRRKQ